MGTRINTIMQTCFFAISGVLPREEAIAPDQARHREDLRQARRRGGAAEFRGGRRDARPSLRGGRASVARPPRVGCRRWCRTRRPTSSSASPRSCWRTRAIGCRSARFRSTAPGRPARRSGRSATSPTEIPVWDQELCIQCNKCALVCPHAAIRVKVYPHDALAGAPHTFKHVAFKSVPARTRSPAMAGTEPPSTRCRSRLKTAPAAALCVMMCPAKDKKQPRHTARSTWRRRRRCATPSARTTRSSWTCRRSIARAIKPDVKSTQFLEPLFEYSGACAGCGETPYLKLMTQLFGDRVVVANATGCSSIYGGNLPTTPYTDESRRPRAGVGEFAVRGQRRIRATACGCRSISTRRARVALADRACAPQLPSGLRGRDPQADQRTEAGIAAQRERRRGGLARLPVRDGRRWRCSTTS